MSTRKRAYAVALVVLLAASSSGAAPGGPRDQRREQPRPVMAYLQGTVRPLLEATHTAVVALQGALGSLQSSLAQVLTATTDVQSVVASQPRLHVVKTRLTTYPDAIATLNLDVESLPVGAFTKIKKYSVTLKVLAAGMPTGVDRVQVQNGVFDGVDTTYDMTVAEFDPAVNSGVALPPYVGTNSFLHVYRGADGLGPIDVLVNAYVESEP